MWSSARPPQLAAIPLLAAALVGPGCIDIVGADLGRYVEREDKQFTVTGKPDVLLKTFDGSIEIRTWNRNEVHVTIEKRGRSKEAVDAIEVRSQQDGNHVTLEARVPEVRRGGLHFNDSRSARLIVSMPAEADLSAGSGDGSIDIEGVSGRLQLRSGDGSIHGRGLGGDLDVHTGDGSITIDGTLTALRAHSGDGNVTVQAGEGSATAADWEITTGDGSVTLVIPDGFGAELDAHTGDGGIRAQDIAVSNVTGRIDRSSLKGRIGGGGHSLKVRSGDGSITIRKK